MKILWIDTETTGLTNNSSPIQISGVIEVDGSIKEEFNIFLKPFDGADIQDEALQIHGLSLEEINNFQDNILGYKELLKIFDKYIDKYDRNDKFIVAGYNVDFDLKQIRKLAEVHGDKYINSYLSYSKIDPLQMIVPFQAIKKLPILENNKLETWCKYFEIPLKAHDSLEDIKATRTLFYKIVQ
ncbi:exonuclease domain-containing protein [Cetobacterium sp. SF1]|uniref:3'-5' exonuclease n=1 Tax=Cetobacterium sp. SF1 TaxID=3417654 RepID=UPI003CE9FDD0